jgi:CheY-like chemotaxis protein
MSSTRSSWPPPPRASDPGSARQPAARVLVIDDDEKGLSLVSDLLEEAGFVALCQSSPFGAADLAARAGVAAAVIDVKRSVHPDSKLVRRFRRRAELRDLPIVLVSSGATERVDQSSLSGVVLLAKANVPLALVPLLRSLVEERA